jgi:Ca-activated chloride channel family protein
MQTLAARRSAMIMALVLVLLLAACGGAAPAGQAPADASGAAAPAPTAAAAPPAATMVAAAETTAAPAAAAPIAAATQASAAEAAAAMPPPTPQPRPEEVAVNPFTRAAEDNLSTFALDVDTASYSAARAYLEAGALPPPELIRVEEFINAFDYGYPRPAQPFGITVDGAPAPFGAAGNQLVRVGIQGMAIDGGQRDPAVLTFVIDVSGSMQEPNRLPLVKESLRLLVEELRDDDQVGIVVYGSRARVLLEHTPASEGKRIVGALDSLGDEGSTNVEEGLRAGYDLAGRAFQRGASNRVILASDGVANVGATGPEAILRVIRDRAAQGIYLTTVGFGMGDYNDQLMEQLANDGNGSYAYVDDLDEARRIFVENLTGTLQVIAKDAKAQVVFNPAVVSQYRLLGYENRAVADADFRNDRVDAGEIGAGHSVTALYEVALTGQAEGELLTVQLRWADPRTGSVSEIAQPFGSPELGAELAAGAPGLRLAAAAAGFAELLRGSPYAGDRSLADLQALLAPLAAERPDDAALQELRALVDRASGLTR